ncbi:hypothetical protein [Mesorhizobium sp. ANAO-SY3R2]|uniref:hypothetical protein n=1 Tax=Mesorhizobium sp. ANAO-SY3R2 TaxID=3166644 RepID=UPI00366F258B
MLSSSLEARAKKAAAMRAYRASQTPEQVAKDREKARLRMAANYARMSGTDRARKVARGNEAKRKQRRARRHLAEIQREERRVANSIENSAAWTAAPEKLFARVRKAVLSSLPRDVRDDVASDIVLALFDGHIAVDQIEMKAKSYINAHYRSRDFHSTFSIDTRPWQL